MLLREQAVLVLFVGDQDHRFRPFMNTYCASGALLLEVLLGLACDEPWQTQQVVGGAAEDEDPVDVSQSSQLDLGERAGLLQPAEGLLDQKISGG